MHLSPAPTSSTTMVSPSRNVPVDAFRKIFVAALRSIASGDSHGCQVLLGMLLKGSTPFAARVVLEDLVRLYAGSMRRAPRFGPSDSTGAWAPPGDDETRVIVLVRLVGMRRHAQASDMLRFTHDAASRGELLDSAERVALALGPDWIEALGAPDEGAHPTSRSLRLVRSGAPARHTA